MGRVFERREKFRCYIGALYAVNLFVESVGILGIYMIKSPEDLAKVKAKPPHYSSHEYSLQWKLPVSGSPSGESEVSTVVQKYMQRPPRLPE